MSANLKLFKTILTAILMVSFLVACGPKEPEIKVVSVTGISVSPKTLSIEPGGTANLTATVSPSNATDKTVTWSSSDQSVATVNNGTVSAVAEGTATITATVGGLSATCSVTVSPDMEALIKAALLKIYDAMDGKHWKTEDYNSRKAWKKQTPLENWSWVEWDKSTGDLKLIFWDTEKGEPIGLKGEFPDCFEELPWLTRLHISNEPGITGTLPPSFNKLKNSKYYSK